jgi:Tc5 transposase DNA-binding domain
MGDVIFDVLEFSKAERLDIAYRAWKSDSNTDSIQKLAMKFGVLYASLQGRIKGAIPIKELYQSQQLLCPREEESLKDWCIQLARWGWPPRISQLRAMAVELLRAKGSTESLGVHWQDRFFLRYPELKAKYLNGLDKNRFATQDPIVISVWFKLYKDTIKEYNIQPSDIYNIDEKGFIVGML